MDEDEFIAEFDAVCRRVRQNEREKGFDSSMENFPEKIALIHSEASEALEDWRKNREDHIGEELADIVIRVMALAEGIDVDLGDELMDKIEKNADREEKHGGRKI